MTAPVLSGISNGQIPLTIESFGAATIGTLVSDQPIVSWEVLPSYLDAAITFDVIDGTSARLRFAYTDPSLWIENSPRQPQTFGYDVTINAQSDQGEYSELRLSLLRVGGDQCIINIINDGTGFAEEVSLGIQSITPGSSEITEFPVAGGDYYLTYPGNQAISFTTNKPVYWRFVYLGQAGDPVNAETLDFRISKNIMAGMQAGLLLPPYYYDRPADDGSAYDNTYHIYLQLFDGFNYSATYNLHFTVSPGMIPFPPPPPPAPPPPTPAPPPPAPPPPVVIRDDSSNSASYSITVNKIKTNFAIGFYTYQCSVCRRSKSVAKDIVRTGPARCVITKNCTGVLNKIGETSTMISTPTVAGLTDWSARDSNILTEQPAEDKTYALSCAANGTLTLALQVNSAFTLANKSIVLKLLQRKTQNVAYQQYLWKLTAATSVISGRDSNSKNLRFDQAAIDDARVFVTVNGVRQYPPQISLSPNTVTFASTIAIGSVVDVSVYAEKSVIEKHIKFNLNSIGGVSTAWSNISTVWQYDNVGMLGTTPLSLYSSELLGNISDISSYEVAGIWNETLDAELLGSTSLGVARFLLASSPFENPDRYLNFSISLTALTSGFNLTSTKSNVLELTVRESFLTEHFPPFKLLKNVSYLKADTYTSSSAIPADTILVKIPGKKIIGPI